MVKRAKSLPYQDLEAFQRWAMLVDDQLRDAVNAVMALEDADAEPLHDCSDLRQADRSSADLASDVIQEVTAFRENPDRPTWFTPAFQMVLVVSTWAEFLTDYVDEVMSQGPSHVGAAHRHLIIETIGPAVEHFHQFLDAVHAAGHLSS